MNEEAVKQLYDLIKGGNGWNGHLNPNDIWANIFNKITTQRIISTFDFNDKFFARYSKKSSLYGDKSEIISYGLGRIEDWKDSKGEWIKDKAFVEAYVNIAPFNIDKQYAYTLTDTQMQQAFKSEKTFGNAIAQIRKSIMDQKEKYWYETIINTHKTSYKNIINIKVKETDSEEVKNRKITNTILTTIKAFTLPSTKFNVIPDEKRLKLNACPIDNQIFTWNIKNMVDYETSITQNFNMGEIPSVKKLLSSNYADYGDDSIIGVLDTDETIYIGIKTQYSNYQTFAKDRYTNFYYNELGESAVVGFTNGVVFKLVVEKANPKPISK